MNLPSLEIEVVDHGHDAKDREGVPHESIDRAPVHDVGELLQS